MVVRPTKLLNDKDLSSALTISYQFNATSATALAGECAKVQEKKGEDSNQRPDKSWNYSAGSSSTRQGICRVPMPRCRIRLPD